MTILRLVILALVAASVAHAEEIRTWTDLNGRKLDAKYMFQTEHFVWLRTPNGDRVEVEHYKLSSADIEYVFDTDAKRKAKARADEAATQAKLDARPAPVDNSPLVTKTDRFGVCLGESVETVEWKCQKARKSIDRDSLKFEDEDNPGRIWSFKGALNGNDAVNITKLFFFNNRVFQIEFLFKDSSLLNFKVLANSLEMKYGKNQAGVFDSMESKSSFSTTDGDQKINIVLNHDVGFMNGDTLSLRYVHETLYGQLRDEISNRKASKVADDL